MKGALLACVFMACTSDDGPGLDAKLFVPDAEYVAGAAPRATGGPSVVRFTPSYASRMGTRPVYLRGKLAASASAVLLGRAGDPGYFIVSAGLPDLEEPTYPGFDVRAEIAGLPADQDVSLWARAVDTRGRVGEAREVSLAAEPDEPEHALLVQLRWDAPADLDLHVITPDGVELWWGDVRAAAADDSSAGLFDRDAQAGCVASSLREESVHYGERAPAGAYEVRVASASLCGERAVPFEVEVRVGGRRQQRAPGISVPSDALLGVRAGGGVTALRFQLP